ncbi:MAG: peptidylprolyl isomerase [Desulfobacterales bacterium]|nr:peptidylprolyl isomerase [Desulfobacterales bacterium]
MAKASARHILVDDEKLCNDLIEQINNGTDFAELAKKHSKCPSGQQGGDLGEFGRGAMVPEFDQVVFNEELGKAHGPVKTDFGFHVLEITSRKDD